MAEERSTLRGAAGPPAPASTAPAAATSAASGDTQEIREQIERTREGMGRTIDELQDRLSPEHVMQQAKDTLHDATVGRVKEMVNTASESARDTATNMAERAQHTAYSLAGEARAHPVTTAALGAGVAWLLSGTSLFRRQPNTWDDDARPTTYRSSNVQREYDMSNGYGQGSWTDLVREHPMSTALAALSIGYLVMQRDSGRARSHEPWPRDQWGAGHDGPGVRQAVGDAGEKVGEWGEQLSDGVRRAGSQVRESAEELTGQVQERWQQTRRRTASEFEHWMDENPLAVGAAALAAGLALGFSTPRSRFEDEYMGPTRDALVERTSDAAGEAAEEIGERVKAAAASLAGDDASSSPSGVPAPSSARQGQAAGRPGQASRA